MIKVNKRSIKGNVHVPVSRQLATRVIDDVMDCSRLLLLAVRHLDLLGSEFAYVGFILEPELAFLVKLLFEHFIECDE